MQAEDVGSLPIVEGERLLGILTARDVVRGVADGVSPDTAAADLVAPNLEADVAAGESIEAALAPHMRRVPAQVEIELRDRECAVGIFPRLPSGLKGWLCERQPGRWQMIVEIAEPETYTLAELLQCVCECTTAGELGDAHVAIEGREYLIDPEALAALGEQHPPEGAA